VAVSVTVNNVIADTTAPSIVITSPTSGATISGTYNIGVTAADTSGVSKVEFSLDNGAVAFTDLVAPYNYSLNTTGLSNGAHTINVKAFDTPGNSRSASVNVTVNNGPAPVAKCDVTGDGRVNIQDLVILLNNYGKTVTSGTNGDCNNSGTVNIQDLVILIGQYGQ
jgi:hypothetical protein